MLHLSSCLHRNPDNTAKEIIDIDREELSYKAQSKLCEAYMDLSISPIAIQSNNIAFIPLINAMLGFELPNCNSVRYFQLVKRKSRKKEVFFNELNQ